MQEELLSQNTGFQRRLVLKIKIKIKKRKEKKKKKKIYEVGKFCFFIIHSMTRKASLLVC